MTTDHDSLTLITAICGFAFGLVGTVLGALNTWKEYDRDRLKIRVTPVWIISADSQMFGICIVNLSNYAVTINDVGFTHKNGKDRYSVQAYIINGGSLPRKVESRESITVVVDNTILTKKYLLNIDRAYASTQCGNCIKGTSPCLEQLKKNAPAH
jgi:hypothetical protein